MAWLVVPVLPSSAGNGFSGYSHGAWALQEGAPADIWSIAQSDDGYLWLGTGFGLHRFDGVRFERFDPPDGGSLPSSNITAVSMLRSGDLWIGYYQGGLTRIRDGRMTHYGVDDGVPRGMVYRIIEDASGDLWAAIGVALLRFRDGHWVDARTASNFPAASADWVEEDDDGALWVATVDSVYVRPAGGSHFERTGLRIDSQAVLARSPRGGVWISDAGGGTRPIRRRDDGTYRDAREEFPELAGIHAARLLFREDGSLWGTHRGRGVFMVPTLDAGVPGTGREALKVQRFTHASGLTSDTAVPLFDDKEGNLWVGTILGLNRFRYRNVISLPQPLASAGGYDQAIRADDGSVLIASTDGVLMEIDRAAVQRLLAGGLLRDEVERTRANAWWLRDGQELWRFDAGRASRVPFPGDDEGAVVDAMLLDANRRLWVSIGGHGVYVRTGGEWRHRPDLPMPAPVVMAGGLDGRLWFGYRDGRVAVLDGEQVDIHMPGDGLDVGPITALHAGRRHMLVAGEMGLARLDAGSFATLSHEQAFRGVTGILESDEDSLWLNGSRGVVRMSGRDLQSALRQPDLAPGYVLFDQSDGMPGVALQTKPVSSAVNADGLFWFSTNGGMALLDPERIRTNPFPPHVHILSLSTGASDLDLADAGALPPGTSNLEIAYTAMSLSSPERVRFRYRLEGVDDEWRDAGTRREAFYTNLGPGTYRFRVIAANNDGVWNDEGASLELRIRPTFFQSPWFALSCVLLFALTMYVAYLLHMRQLAIRMRARLEERHLERERIARELHDTLLQSMQGLILRLHALAGRAVHDPPLREGMESVMDRAEAVLVEGRERVRGLRTAAREIDDLPTALSAIAGEYGQGDVLTVAIGGEPRRLRPLVRDELYRIGREAIVNAFRHAQAGVIEVSVEYADDALRIVVSDDGTGIEAAILERGDRPGHWGLAGMRERIDRIGGGLSIDSIPGRGTVVRAFVPGARAYAGRRAGWWSRQRRAFARKGGMA